MNTISPAPTVRPMPAQGNALGSGTRMGQALKGRPKGAAWRAGMACGWDAPSGLPSFSFGLPRALPWAGMGCPFGAQAARCCLRGRTPRKDGSGMEVKPGYKQAEASPRSQRQRRCGPKPRVGARNERLPWEGTFVAVQPQRGCGAGGGNRRNPVGVETVACITPRVARSSQPWAGGRNPVGIGCVDGHLEKMGAVWK